VGFEGEGAQRLSRRVPAEEGMAVEPADLIRYGMIPEFVGRLPVITSLTELSEEDLVSILTEPKNAMLRQYQKLLAMEGIALSFTEGALRELAAQAVRRKAGARGLRAIVERLMLDVMYEAPRRGAGGALEITRSMVRRQQVAFHELRRRDRKIA
jgi:ATP-dependent Clp protease ATP-binding subunit ClpX